MGTAPPSYSVWTAVGKREGAGEGKSQTAAAVMGVTTTSQSQFPPLPSPGWSPCDLGWGVGRTHPRPPLPSSDSLLGGSTHFFRQETEAHREEEVGEEDTREAGRWHNEGRGERPLDTPHPPRGGVRKPHHDTAFGEMRWGLRLWGSEARRAAGLSQSRASRCALSRILARHPRT